MIRCIAFALVLSAMISFSKTNAQVPESTTIKIESVTVTITNIEVVTSPKMKQDMCGSQPTNPIPLTNSKLYPPDTNVFIKFNYKTDLKPTNDPKGIKSIIAAVDIPKLDENSKGGFQGYGPYLLKDNSGTGYILLSNVFSDEQTKLAEIETNIIVFGQRNNNNQIPSVNTMQKVRFKISIDRFAQISETQFDALKSLHKRIQDLENRVKELESQRTK